jgi:hypothetical protein
MPTQPKFFTWVEETYEHPSQVPERIRAYMQILWLNGTTVEELAKTFKIPVDWIEDFVRASYAPPRPS